MLLPTKGHLICEIILRERQLPSGLWMADKQRLEKKDNICRCIGVGEGVKIAERGDLIHFKAPFGHKFTYEGKKMIALKAEEIIALERDNEIIAVGSMVICKLVQEDKIGSIVVPDNVKQNSGEYHGEVVSVGPDYPDKSLKKNDKLIFLRSEGYRFRGYYDRVEYLSIKERWIYGKQD